MHAGIQMDGPGTLLERVRPVVVDHEGVGQGDAQPGATTNPIFATATALAQTQVAATVEAGGPTVEGFASPTELADTGFFDG